MTPKNKISRIILELTEKIKRQYKPEKIILYGSYAYGHPTDESDIDLLIVKNTSERPIERRVAVRRIVDIRDASHPAFSPLVITPDELKRQLDIGDQFLADIIKRGKVLYAH